MRTKQSGSSMIETLVSVTLGIMFMGGVVVALNHVKLLNKAAREGELLAEGALALQDYLNKHGLSIVVSGTASGFSNPLQPTAAQLKAGDFLPSYTPSKTPFDGTLSFTVRKGVQNDLFGLVCDTQTITEGGTPSPQLAGAVITAANGAGLRTSVATPTMLNGPAHTSILSPISGPSIVCAWAYLPSPI